MKNKSFDAVAFMRKRRADIDKEDANLSWSEKRKKTKKLVEKDPLRQRLNHRTMSSRRFKITVE